MACCGDYNAGMLKTPVVFQRKSQSPDGAGGWTETWAALSGSPTRAYVKAASGFERFLSNRVDAQSRWKVVVRYFSGLLEADRIQIDGRFANIRFINNVEMKNRWLEIEVEFGVAS